jgi:ABC-2 type transport system permease protein
MAVETMVKTKEKKPLIEWTPIYSMWLREIIRFVNMKPRVISSIIQPFLFLGLMAIPFSRLMPPEAQGLMSEMFGGLSFFGYLAPGIVGIGLLTTGIMGGVTVIWDKEFGFLKEVMVAPVRRISLMIGRSLGGMTIAIMQALLTIGVASLFGMSPQFNFRVQSAAGLGLAVVFIIFTFCAFIGAGITLGGMFEETEGFMSIVMLLQMPLLFLSGAFVPIARLEGVPVLYQLQFINPLTYGIDGIRASLTGASPFFPLWVDLVVIFAFALVFLILGARAFNRMQLT